MHYTWSIMLYFIRYYTVLIVSPRLADNTLNFISLIRLRVDIVKSKLLLKRIIYGTKYHFMGLITMSNLFHIPPSPLHYFYHHIQSSNIHRPKIVMYTQQAKPVR